MNRTNNAPNPKRKISLSIPILPGQTEAWRRFVQELQGPWRKEWAEWRQRVGIHELQFQLQTSSQQTVVLLQARIDQEMGHAPLWAAENAPFDRWLRKQLLLLHGVDLLQLGHDRNCLSIFILFNSRKVTLRL